MRHFLALAPTPLRLSPGVMEPTPKRLLVAPARPPHALAPRLSGAGLHTVPLPVIAAPAHPQLSLTPRTAPHAVAENVDRTTFGRPVATRSSTAGIKPLVHAHDQAHERERERTRERREDVGPLGIERGALKLYETYVARDRSEVDGAKLRLLV